MTLDEKFGAKRLIKVCGEAEEGVNKLTLIKE